MTNSDESVGSFPNLLFVVSYSILPVVWTYNLYRNFYEEDVSIQDMILHVGILGLQLTY